MTIWDPRDQLVWRMYLEYVQRTISSVALLENDQKDTEKQRRQATKECHTYRSCKLDYEGNNL